MVVNNLDLPRFPIAPNEADTPSVIDANTVLTATVRPQSFEAIAGRVLAKRLVGDVDYQQVRPKARAITPVPNGVGPMMIALLLYNTVWAAKRQVRLE